MCYQSEVERRNMKYVSDEATLEKIGKAAKFLCGNGKFGLLLYGTVGSGKTTLAKAICNIIGILYNSDLSSERKGVYRISALNLAKSIADDPTYFNKLKNQELLFIDDVGTEPASVKSWGNEFSPVTELIYARYDRQLFTIATSNLADEEFGDRYGERIADRMEEILGIGTKVSGIMPRVAVEGTPKYELGEIDENRIAQITAIFRIFSKDKIEDMIIHPLTEKALRCGANSLVVDIGAIPRDNTMYLDAWNGQDIEKSKEILLRNGFDVKIK